jgi:tetratricopeptide (TPR) repeat protein
MKRKFNSSYRKVSSALEEQLSQKLQQGLRKHQDGFIQEAKTIYKEILNIQPMYFHAMHLLGLIATQEKNYQLAVDLISKAIEIYPDNPPLVVSKKLLVFSQTLQKHMLIVGMLYSS